MQSDTPASKSLIVLVNYYNDKELCDFINRELLNQDPLNFQITVVNNGSANSDELKEMLNPLPVVFLDPGKNLGYLHAFLFAVDYYNSQHGRFPDIMILSNTDMFLNSKSLLHDIEDKYRNTEYACIGPRILSTRHKTDQNPFFISRVKKSRLNFIRFVDRFYPLYLIYQTVSLIKFKVLRIGKSIKDPQISGKVYALHGSFIVFSNKFIKACIVDLRKAPFLFGEEIYIAEVARLHNMDLYFDTTFLVNHDEHATTGTYKSRKIIQFEYNSISEILNLFFK